MEFYLVRASPAGASEHPVAFLCLWPPCGMQAILFQDGQVETENRSGEEQMKDEGYLLECTEGKSEAWALTHRLPLFV